MDAIQRNDAFIVRQCGPLLYRLSYWIYHSPFGDAGTESAAVPPYSGTSLRAMMGWRDGVMAAALAAAISTPCGCPGAAAQALPAPAHPCGGDIFARGHVGRVIDGRTFALDDGRAVRLAGVEVPPLSPQPGTGAAPGAQAKATLNALLGDDNVVLRKAEYDTDRYGRLVAYAFAVRDGDEIFTQGELISSGYARLGDQVASRACAMELLRRESAARHAKLGLWADAYYDVLQADHPADVLAQRGQFALVEGKVASVHESGATIYVNFGQRWSEDFAVTILKRNERSFTAAGLDLKGLAGRNVMVRGWIEGSGSPRIMATRPEQIGLADE